MAAKNLNEVVDYEHLLKAGITGMMQSFVEKGCISEEHVKDTPDRVAKAFGEYFEGVDKDPAAVLKKGFRTEKPCTEMVTLYKIDFISFCAHHLTPIIGFAHFAYIPRGRIVGLSKIPRMIEILAHRPQVQENLCQQIVDVFHEEVKPAGCGVVIDALHLCMAIRGIKKSQVMTRTTALRGVLLSADTAKSEFLNSIPEQTLPWS